MLELKEVEAALVLIERSLGQVKSSNDGRLRCRVSQQSVLCSFPERSFLDIHIESSHPRLFQIVSRRNHWEVLTKLKGSVWKPVLPFCFINMLITLGILFLDKFTDIDLTFNGGVGYRYISTLVSFFTISQLGSTYGRFWEARGHLGTMMIEANMLAARAALYTAHDHSDKADAWRLALKKNLITFIDRALVMIQDDTASTLFNVMDHEKKTLDAEKHGISRNSNLLKKAAKLEEDKDVIECAMAVDATILTAGDHVKDGCKNGGELLGGVKAIMGAYFNLLKFSTTPRPFVIEQMGRTLVFIWILTLPGAVLDSHKEEPFEALFLVFIVTYGFIGLTLTDVELHDPLGDDPNDLMTKNYLALIKNDIEKLLGEDSLSSKGTLLSSAYHVSDGKGYGAV